MPETETLTVAEATRRLRALEGEHAALIEQSTALSARLAEIYDGNEDRMAAIWKARDNLIEACKAEL